MTINIPRARCKNKFIKAYLGDDLFEVYEFINDVEDLDSLTVTQLDQLLKACSDVTAKLSKNVPVKNLKLKNLHLDDDTENLSERVLSLERTYTLLRDYRQMYEKEEKEYDSFKDFIKKQKPKFKKRLGVTISFILDNILKEWIVQALHNRNKKKTITIDTLTKDLTGLPSILYDLDRFEVRSEHDNAVLEKNKSSFIKYIREVINTHRDPDNNENVLSTDKAKIFIDNALNEFIVKLAHICKKSHKTIKTISSYMIINAFIAICEFKGLDYSMLDELEV